VVLTHGKPEDAPGTHVQHAGQTQLALGGVDLGAIAEPALIQSLGAEVSTDQGGGVPTTATRACGVAPAAFGPGFQPLFDHQRRDGVLADPPPHLA
jgi:hypothetical protein